MLAGVASWAGWDHSGRELMLTPLRAVIMSPTFSGGWVWSVCMPMTMMPSGVRVSAANCL